ncbi:LamG domain-containing protein [Candidatus Poribacteria bacterium]|nr:LamG domain-containing protein [Candidatus Poribacteria bacterium]
MNLDTGLIGYWPFRNDCNDHSGSGLISRPINVQLKEETGIAQFNGLDSHIVVQDAPALHLGTGDFSIALWIRTDEHRDVIGDILSKFDPQARRGFGLSVVTNSGVTSTAQANYRNLHFGMDAGKIDADWKDEGRPGNAVQVKALHVSEGSLYAGTFEAGAQETGHLWQYEGPGRWKDLGGCPDGSNAVPSIARFNGNLYCSTGRYNSRGSALGPPENTAPGGSVYRIDGDGKWIDCGQPGIEDATPEEVHVDGYETGKADMTGSLTVFRGELYATSYYRRGVFKYEGGRRWQNIGLDRRLFSFVVYKQELYALINGGEVSRYLGGKDWEDCGTPSGSTQTYGAATYAGDLYVGTWPGGDVQRYEGDKTWTNIGRAGEEKEVMGMAVYNQKMYVGTLPLANVWRMDSGGLTLVGNIDNTPDVMYRRAWSMAVYNGKLFAGTLPSGHVWSLQAGVIATDDRAIPSGWHHIAAVRCQDRLKLYIDGQCVSRSNAFNPADYDLTQGQPLTIGFGAHTYFHGAMSDLRLYNLALTNSQIEELARTRS